MALGTNDMFFDTQEGSCCPDHGEHCVLPYVLARREWIAGRVEQIIEKLERRANLKSELSQMPARAIVRAGDQRTDLDGRTKQRARFQFVDADGFSRISPRGPQVAELSTYQAERTDRLRQYGNASGTSDGIDVGQRGKDAIRPRQQRHGRENGGVLAMGTVQRRLAPSQQGIVHARKVVQHQRRRMDHLDGASRVDRGPGGSSKALNHQNRHGRPQPLSRAQNAVPDGPREGVMTGQNGGTEFGKARIHTANQEVDLQGLSHPWVSLSTSAIRRTLVPAGRIDFGAHLTCPSRLRSLITVISDGLPSRSANPGQIPVPLLT